jgi:hypothetical protein
MPISTRGRQQVTKDGDAAHDFLGALAHQQVVAGHERLALGTVDDQLLHRHRLAGVSLAWLGKAAPPRPTTPASRSSFAHALGRQAPVIERRARDPLVTPIRLDDHAQRRQARRVRSNMLFDGQNACRRSAHARPPTPSRRHRRSIAL